MTQELVDDIHKPRPGKRTILWLIDSRVFDTVWYPDFFMKDRPRPSTVPDQMKNRSSRTE